MTVAAASSKEKLTELFSPLESAFTVTLSKTALPVHNELHTPETLPSFLDFFQSGGYKVVPISQIILTDDYYMDHTGKHCPAEE